MDEIAVGQTVASFFLGARVMSQIRGLPEPDDGTSCKLLNALVEIEAGRQTTIPINNIELLIEWASAQEAEEAMRENRTTEQNLARLILRRAGHPGF